MNKKDLVEEVAKTLEASKIDSEKYVSAVIETIKKGVVKDGEVQLVGFGSFKMRKRKPRTGLNPRTREQIKIKASKTVTFRAGKAFKDAL